jgi:hypothetical protein
MKRLPLLVDPQPSVLVRAGIYILAPVVVILTLPIILLVILVLYLAALVHGARIFVFVITGEDVTPTSDFQKPHVLESQVLGKKLPDNPQDLPSERTTAGSVGEGESGK